MGAQPILDVLRLLRNLISHGGMRNEAVCTRDLEVFLPYLQKLVEGPFSFLTGWEMPAIQGSYDDDVNRGRVSLLHFPLLYGRRYRRSFL